MAGDFTDRWTTAAANQIQEFISGVIAAERDACAAIVEQESQRGATPVQIAEKIRRRKVEDNDFLQTWRAS